MRKLVTFFTSLLVVALFLAPIGEARAASFSDVGTTHRAKEEINFLVDRGIVQGVSPTKFAPQRNVTRAEAAIIIGRALEVDGSPRATRFKDIENNSFASGYIEELVEKGVLGGYGDDTFRPSNQLTRGEMALMINRAFYEPTSSNAVAIQKLMNEGIAQGVKDGTFGEKLPLIRSDFSVFIARVLDDRFAIPKDQRFVKQKFVDVKEGPVLNMRSGPSADTALVTSIPNGSIVRLAIDTKDDATWVRVKAGDKVGYVHSGYLSDKKPTHVSTNPNSPLAKKLIVLDPGHGGSDPGAIGFGYAEKTATLAISNYAKKYFDQSPFQVAMTRTNDTFVSLANRVRFVHNRNADAFVSIHINSASSSSATGLESYYSASRAAGDIRASRALTTYMQHRMLEAWGLSNRGVKTAPFYVIRWTNMPSTLLEMGFISNKNDNYRIRTPKHQEQMGRAVYLGALDYYYHYEGYKNDIAPLYSKVGAKPSPRRH